MPPSFEGRAVPSAVFPGVRWSSAIHAFGYHAIVVENAMNPSPSHFAHWAVGENRGVFNRNVSLIIEPIRDPTAQRFRRKLAFVHRHMERMFIVISAHADRPQFFDERFPIPESVVIKIPTSCSCSCAESQSKAAE